MKLHDVRVHPETDRLKREDQLAWKIAAVAADAVPVLPEVAEMIINRMIDNASVAIASINRHPIVTARDQALAHARPDGATLFGCAPSVRVHAEWAAWANGTAVRELDYHDTFLAAEYSHPGDNIPPILATAQQTGRGRGGPGPGAGHRLRDPGRSGALDLSARTQDRPRGPSRPVRRRRHRHPARAGHRDHLPGRAAGPARDDRDAAKPERRDQQLEGVCAEPRRQAGDRGGGPRHARRGRAERRSTRARTA